MSLLLLFGGASITFDAASGSGYKTASSTYSWNHTCAGTDRYLVVGISMLSVIGSSVTGITYNGVAMTFLGSRASVSGAVRVELWGLVAPATGTNSIAVTLSAGLDSIGSASSYNGVHQVSPAEGEADASATNVGAADATVNVVTVAVGDMVVDIVATDDTAITVGAGQTSRNNQTGALGSGAMSSEGPISPAGSVTMSWTAVAALATWSIAAIALRPVAASTLVLSVNLGGVAGTGAAGLFVPSIYPGFTGVQGSGSPGTFTPLDLPGITGVQAAGGVGAFVPTVIPGFTGVQGSGSAGTFTSADLPGITGVQGVGAAGTFTPSVLFGIVGVQGVGAAGTALADTAVRIELVGVGASGSAGTFTPTVVVVGFSGVAGAGSPGSFVPTDLPNFTGVGAVGGVGSFTLTGGFVAPTFTGVQGVGSAGTIIVSILQSVVGGREFSAALKRILNQPRLDDAYLILAELSHEALGGQPLRFANNTEDVISNGATYIGFPFDVTLPGDEEGPPRGKIAIQNVDRRIGITIRGLSSPPRLRLMVVLASDPDTVWLDYKHFWFRNIRMDALHVEGDVDSWDFATEPWPNRRATADRFPGLFW